MTSSTSRDAAIRQAEREGGGLLARYRAGLLEVAYPCAPDVACPCSRCEGHGLSPGGAILCGDAPEFATQCSEPDDTDGACGGCQVAHSGEPCSECSGSGKGRVPAEPEDLLRLLAFCGVEEARALVPNTGMLWHRGRPSWPVVDAADLPTWVAVLSRLCAKLPARRVEVECREGKRHNHGICEPCNGTGKVHQGTRANRWLLVADCVAVGRECCAVEGCDACRAGSEEPEDHDRQCPWHAIGLARAWVAEPTQDRAQAWSASTPAWMTGPAWLPVPDREGVSQAQPLQAAAEVLGETRVRELVCAEVVRRVEGVP